MAIIAGLLITGRLFEPVKLVFELSIVSLDGAYLAKSKGIFDLAGSNHLLCLGDLAVSARTLGDTILVEVSLRKVWVLKHEIIITQLTAFPRQFKLIIVVMVSIFLDEDIAFIDVYF